MNKANPMPLGLLGYGMTVVLYSFTDLGTYQLGGMVFSMAILFGGVSLIVVSAMLFTKGDSFGTTLFAGYGYLWLSWAIMSIGEAHRWWALDGKEVGYYLLLWAIFTLGLVMASTVGPRLLTMILVLTTILLVSLGFAAINQNASLAKFAGYEGIITGALAIYLAFALLINETHGDSKFPVGKPFQSK